MLFTILICPHIFSDYFSPSNSSLHIPLLSFPSRFIKPISLIKEMSRSTVRWLTDKVSDICLAVIDGDSLTRSMILR